MGLAVANMRGFDIPARRPFFETLVQLIIGVLFVAISATVAPYSLRHLILPTLVLVAVLVLVTRPLVAQLATIRTDMPTRERWFTGWMAPRGIVAAATASTFSTGLVKHGIGGASKILPVTYLVIVATVTLYGLTAAPAARMLGVIRPGRTRPLLVGGEAWVVGLACGLRSAGLDVLMWAGFDEEREHIKVAGFELAPDEQLEGVNAVLLLTSEDDFNARASTVLAGKYRKSGVPSRAPAAQPRRGGAVHGRPDPLRRGADQVRSRPPLCQRCAHRQPARGRSDPGRD
jgi:energy-converting hydrogenase Eha subunit A